MVAGVDNNSDEDNVEERGQLSLTDKSKYKIRGKNKFPGYHSVAIWPNSSTP